MRGGGAKHQLFRLERRQGRSTSTSAWDISQKASVEGRWLVSGDPHAYDGIDEGRATTTNLRELALYSRSESASLMSPRAAFPVTANRESVVKVSRYIWISRGLVIVRKPDTSSTLA